MGASQQGRAADQSQTLTRSSWRLTHTVRLFVDGAYYRWHRPTLLGKSVKP